MEHVRYIDRTRDYYKSQGYDKPYQWAQHDDVPFAPLRKPLAESRLALISTSEIASRQWEDQRTPLEKGETGNVYSIASDTPVADLYSQSHSFDKNATTLDDINAFFPITHLHDFAADGRIGSIAANAHGVYNSYSQRRTNETDAPELLRRLREDAADVALLVPV